MKKFINYDNLDNITLESVANILDTLIQTLAPYVPDELLSLQQDIAKELSIEDERPNECNRLIEEAYNVFDKYIFK